MFASSVVSACSPLSRAVIILCCCSSFVVVVVVVVVVLTRGVTIVTHSRARDIKKSAHTRCIHCESELRIWRKVKGDVTDGC